MRRCPHMISFRLTEVLKRRYHDLIAKRRIPGVHGWTDLVLKALWELSEGILAGMEPLRSSPIIPSPASVIPVARHDLPDRSYRKGVKRTKRDSGKTLDLAEKERKAKVARRMKKNLANANGAS